MKKPLRCKSCKYLVELHTPKEFGVPKKYGYCCTLCINEGKIINLGEIIPFACSYYDGRYPTENSRNVEFYRDIASNISNDMYRDNIDAVKELVELFDNISRYKLSEWSEYVKMYDESFYTYRTFHELVESEKDYSDGLTKEELIDEIGVSIWKLPCGWYVQCV